MRAWVMNICIYYVNVGISECKLVHRFGVRVYFEISTLVLSVTWYRPFVYVWRHMCMYWYTFA